jgi:hypothetical protein
MTNKVDWADKFNVIKSTSFKINENKEWKFTIEEHKQKGTLQINARCWTVSKKEGGYSGPSKSGFIIPINSVEDFDTIKECFQTFIDFVENSKEVL